MTATRFGSRSQRGSVLLVALILLLIFAGMAATMFRGSLTSAQAIGNMQWRAEAVTAANDAIDRILSTTQFVNNTSVVAASSFDVDINGDGVNDIRTTMPVVTINGVARAGPRCLSTQPVPMNQLDPAIPADVGCLGSGSGAGSGLGQEQSGGGTSGVSSGPSLCSDTNWQITVRAVDAVTNTSVDVVQGVAVRVPTTDVTTCN